MKFPIMLTEGNFAARLKQGYLVNKADFDNKKLSFIRKITSNKTNIEKFKKPNFFLGRIYLQGKFILFLEIIYLWPQNTFVYQQTLHALVLKRGKGTDYVLSWKSQDVYYLSPYVVFSNIA